jgi:hypothetical protein
MNGSAIIQQSSKLLEIVDGMVRALAQQESLSKRSGDGDDTATSGLPGEHSGQRIFDHEALGWIGFEPA